MLARPVLQIALPPLLVCDALFLAGNMPGLYTDECGVIVNPRAVKVLCSGPNDISSWNFGCKQRDLYPPDKLEAMLNISWNRERWRANNGSVGEFK